MMLNILSYLGVPYIKIENSLFFNVASPRSYDMQINLSLISTAYSWDRTIITAIARRGYLVGHAVRVAYICAIRGI